MGSVLDDYKCPLCGRVGNGGYALDGVGFPICTEGDFSCLWFQIIDRGLWPGQIVGNAIQKIFWFKTNLPPDTWEAIAAFTCPSRRIKAVPLTPTCPAEEVERAALSRPSARTNIPTTPPSPTEAVVRIGEQIMCSYCSVFTLRRVGERCSTCNGLLRAHAQPLVMRGNIGVVPWPAEWITASGQDSSSSSAESSMAVSSST